jgi:hypothetical protein
MLSILRQSLAPIVPYFRLGWAIARLDKDPILRAAHDDHANRFGIVFLAIAMMAYFSSFLVIGTLGEAKSVPVSIFAGMLAGIVGGGTLLVLVHFSVCHAVLKAAAHSSRRLPEVLRPLLLSAVVLWIAFVPLIGLLALFYWWYIVAPWVFKEMHGVTFGKAFAVFVGMYFALAIPAAILVGVFISLTR